MLHHEGLNNHWPPGIENAEPQGRLKPLKLILGQEQSLPNPLPQPEGIGAGTVGSPQRHIGMRPQTKESGLQGQQRLTAVPDWTITPGPDHQDKGRCGQIARPQCNALNKNAKAASFPQTDRRFPQIESHAAHSQADRQPDNRRGSSINLDKSLEILSSQEQREGRP